MHIVVGWPCLAASHPLSHALTPLIKRTGEEIRPKSSWGEISTGRSLTKVLPWPQEAQLGENKFNLFLIKTDLHCDKLNIKWKRLPHPASQVQLDSSISFFPLHVGRSAGHTFPHFSFKTAVQHFLPFLKYTFSPMLSSWLRASVMLCSRSVLELSGAIWNWMCVCSGWAPAPHHRAHPEPHGSARALAPSAHTGEHEREMWIKKVLKKQQLQLHVTSSSQGWSDLCLFNASSRN